MQRGAREGLIDGVKRQEDRGLEGGGGKHEQCEGEEGEGGVARRERGMESRGLNMQKLR